MLSGRGVDDDAGITLQIESLENHFHEGPVLFEDSLYFVTNRLGPDASAAITWEKTSPP